MTGPELIFLHIPKTAGSSQHKTFNRRYGRANVFWYGDSCPADISSFPAELVADRLLVGGHKPLSFYPQGIDPLYCAVVRQPVERAISLFCYNTRPDLARTEVGRMEREKLLQNMVRQGVDPHSMLRSIKHSAAFRETISNNQCAYLSGSQPTFSAVMDSLKRHDFLIGETSRYERFHGYLAGLLGWSEDPPSAVNQSKPGYLEDFLGDDELIQLIRELNQEDDKLFDFVSREHDGLLVRIRDVSRRSERLARLETMVALQQEFVPHDSAGAGDWPASKPNKLPWPLSSVVVLDQYKLFYSPVSNAVNGRILEVLLDHSNVAHKGRARDYGIPATLSSFNTGMLLRDKPMIEARRIIQDTEYFKFAVLADPMTRLIRFYYETIVFNPQQLVRNPKLMAMVAWIQGLESPDLTRGVTFRQLVADVVRHRPERLPLALMPQHMYLRGVREYRLYRDDSLGKLERDLHEFTGIEADLEVGSTVGSPVMEAEAIAADRRTFPDCLPAALRERGDTVQGQVMDPEIMQWVSDYYRRDYALYAAASGGTATV